MWRLDGLRPRVLLTGIGGPAAQGFIKAFPAGEVDWFGADMDAAMPGFQLMPPDRRAVVPRGDDPSFATKLLEVALAANVDAIVPTVDAELLPIASARSAFDDHGIHVLLARHSTLALCLDKATLSAALADHVLVPKTVRYDGQFRHDEFSGPVVAKPRSGSGGRGVAMVDSASDIPSEIPRDGSYMVQDHLPGREYSIDVMAGSNGTVIAAVPRERIRVDSGIAVAAQTVHDAKLEQFAKTVAKVIGLTSVANVQVKLDARGEPALLEVNPRFPGTMSLTVASGVNMPRLALTDLFGGVIPESVPFRETAMVRTWADHIIDPSSFGQGSYRTAGRAA